MTKNKYVTIAVYADWDEEFLEQFAPKELVLDDNIMYIDVKKKWLKRFVRSEYHMRFNRFMGEYTCDWTQDLMRLAHVFGALKLSMDIKVTA